MEKVTQVNIEGRNYGFVAGQAVKGSCASVAADWVKTIVLPEGVALVEGMVVATLFLNTNSAGFSDPITIYSYSGNVYYYDPEMTEVVDLPPYEDCYVITHIEGTEYRYEAYPVANINGVRIPICDSRGRPCGGPIWSGGDTIASLYLDNKFLMLHSTTINTLQEGSTLPVTSGAVKTACDALSDRCDGLEPVDSVTPDETKAPTSGAVANAINGLIKIEDITINFSSLTWTNYPQGGYYGRIATSNYLTNYTTLLGISTTYWTGIDCRGFCVCFDSNMKNITVIAETYQTSAFIKARIVYI